MLNIKGEVVKLILLFSPPNVATCPLESSLFPSCGKPIGANENKHKAEPAINKLLHCLCDWTIGL